MTADRAASKTRQSAARRRTASRKKNVAPPISKSNTRKGSARRDFCAPLRREGGMGIWLAVVEGVAGTWDQREESYQVVTTKSGGLSSGSVGRLRRVLPRMSRTLAAMGHADRARIMAKLLEGPATYRSLQSLTGMKAGPLYYHLGELRSAGLILPKQRDLYELTRGGRNLALIVVVAESLVSDKRRRPVGTKA